MNVDWLNWWTVFVYSMIVNRVQNNPIDFICMDKSSLWTRLWWIPAHMQLHSGLLTCNAHIWVILEQERHSFPCSRQNHATLLCFNSVSLFYSDLINKWMYAQTSTPFENLVHTYPWRTRWVVHSNIEKKFKKRI